MALRWNPECHAMYEGEFARHLQRETHDPDVFVMFNHQSGTFVACQWIKKDQAVFEELEVLGRDFSEVGPDTVRRLRFMLQTPARGRSKEFALWWRKHRKEQQLAELRETEERSRRIRDKVKFLRNQLGPVKGSAPTLFAY